MKPKPHPIQDGQESVWDYPRPPLLQAVSKQIKVMFNGVEIANTKGAYRVLETSHPPTYYLPPADIVPETIELAGGGSLCEWKGQATYYTVRIGDKQAVRAGWAYHNPTPDFMSIKGFLAFYPAAMEACFVDGEQAQSQPGCFYGGWITSDIVGPFKGEPGSWGW